MQGNVPNMTPEPKKTSVGPVIGIIIIIVILVLGGLYFWGQNLSNNADYEFPEIETTTQQTTLSNDSDPQVQSLESQSSSDELSDIEADLEATNFDSMGSELDTVEAEGGAELE